MNKLLLIGLLAAVGCAEPKDGLNGHDGLAGKDGRSCSVYPAADASGSLILCPDGSSSFVYNGIDGTNGVDGRDGTNAATVEMIKFCPMITGSYGNFPEYGFRLDGKVYAIYSLPVAFLTQLYPGNYTTTSDGQNCSFTVNADGSIQ